MCWSKRSKDDEKSSPTTTWKPMDDLKCSDRSKECDEAQDPKKNYCTGHGLCCYQLDNSTKSCVCRNTYWGPYCQNVELNVGKSIDFQRAQGIAAFSAVLGGIVITLFVTLIVLQIKYYRRRKKSRSQLAGYNHEPNKICRPDASNKGSKRRMTNQPGYSWRESVRRTRSKASHKFRSTFSRSVPDDLFDVDLTLAIFEGCQPNLRPAGHQSTIGKAEVKAVTTQRCLSAGPDLGERQRICDPKDNANASNRPSVVQVPTAATAAEATATPTEDTVM